DVLGATTTYTYDDVHRLLTGTDATGARITNAYDETGRGVRQTDPLGTTLDLAYAGTYPDLVTVVSDDNGIRSSFEHRSGLLVAETRGIDGDAPSRTSHIYDERRHLVATIDPVGGLWRHVRDADGDMVV